MIHYKDSRKKNKQGLCQYFDEKGLLARDFYYENNKKEGIAHSYYFSGKTSAQTPYKNDLKDGEQISYDDSSRVKYKQIFVENKVKSFTSFYNDGVIRRVEAYTNGKMTHGVCYAHNGDTVPYHQYYIKPEPIVGMDSLIKGVRDAFDPYNK